VSDHRWQGYSHEELYRQLHTGPGPGASHGAATRWSALATALADIDADVRKGVMNSHSEWSGSAGDSARDGLHPLSNWAQQAASSADVMRVSHELQAEYVSSARAEMPPPVPVAAEEPSGLMTGLTHLLGAQTDYEIAEAASDAAEQRAFDVMKAYQANTEANTATLGEFTSPPPVAAGIAPLAGAAGIAARQAVRARLARARRPGATAGTRSTRSTARRTTAPPKPVAAQPNPANTQSAATTPAGTQPATAKPAAQPPPAATQAAPPPRDTAPAPRDEQPDYHLVAREDVLDGEAGVSQAVIGQRVPHS
jgi:hypothetical protein